MKFERGEAYSINYGNVTKAVTFVSSNDGINMFFDINGKFALTDSFIKKGSISIAEMDTDFKSNTHFIRSEIEWQSVKFAKRKSILRKNPIINSAKSMFVKETMKSLPA
ncbi:MULTISPECIES: hypothetical protein [Paenibacillus]|uniref:hypothetical protein n=1 Tax=Paenibacillus TaxID=44249 RepID=UPI00096D8819|nr:hypothetical protein [Paenibacillus odorifer]OMD87520.1 hypothetical protein BSK53_00500 [Paenibacillus odorifer]